MTREEISCFLIALQNKINKHLMGFIHTLENKVLFAPKTRLMFSSHQTGFYCNRPCDTQIEIEDRRILTPEGSEGLTNTKRRF